MEFSKQENVSRQSSILKLPKQRQPLQCVATNSSSSENSPTVKIKRRVSFAKNRRIREFCNEAEPESVWDDTYEEHDLSSTKSNCSNTNEHPVIISVPCDDKENFPVQLFLKNNQLECKEIQMVNQNKQDYLLQDHVEIDSTIINIDPKITDIQNKDKNALSTIFYNDVMDITTNISVNMHCRNQVASSLGDTVLVSQTSVTQGTSVKIIEDVPLMSDIGQKIKLDINTESNSTNFSPVISTLLENKCLNKPIINQIEKTTNIKYYSESCQDKENLSNSIQTKFTSTLPSSAWIKSNRQHKIDDESETINKTVKVTTDMYNNTFDNQIINKTIDLSKDIKNFSNKLIERINIVHDKLNEHKAMQEQTKVSSEKSMEITEAVPNCNTNHETNTKIEKLFCEVLQDNVKNSSNQSINIPIAGSVYNRNYQLGAGTNQVVCEEMKKTPKILSNISMEIIKNVPTYETNYQSGTDVKNISHKMIDDQTKISTDKAINVKETVFLGSQNDETSAYNKILICNKKEEKTKNFNNKSMDMSEAVSICNESCQPSTKNEKVHDINTKNRTKLFLNNSMELTEAVQFPKPINECLDKVVELPDQIIQDKTKHFNNKSMEISETIPICNKSYQPSTKNEMVDSISMKERTKLFLNNSMELTEAVQFPKPINECLDKVVELPDQIIQDKTKHFNNKSMEISETIAICNKSYQPSTKNEMVDSISMKERTKLFLNNSMELTEAVQFPKPINECLDKVVELPDQIIQDKTKHFNNKSMEISETIPICNKSYQLLTKNEKVHDVNTKNRTKLFLNNSMELTEAVQFPKPINACLDKVVELPDQIIQDKTKHFNNKSMEISETIPICNKSYQPSTKNEMVDNVSMKERTKLFLNNSMELTEAVQFPKPINECLDKVVELPEQITQDKSKHFNNKSMEIAEVVPVHKNYLNVNTVYIMPNNQGNQDIFMKNLTNNTIIKRNANTEMLIDNKLEKIHDNNEKIIDNSPKLIQDRGNNFMNKSIASLMTDTIYDKNRQAAINIENKLDETEKEKTNMFLNNSNELTEAVPIHHRIHESENNINKIVCKSTCTSKRLPDKPMELTEFTPIHNVDKFNANTDNNSQDLLHERISICNNAWMKNNKRSSFHTDSELPRFSITKNLDASLDKNALCNTLAPKIFPVFEQINKNISTLPSERNFIGNTKSDESLKIMKNTSLDKHSEFTTSNQYSRSVENILYKSMHETKNELNISVDTSKINHVHPFINETNSDVTKNIQTGKSISAFDSKKENYNPNDDENTKIFLNKSMELTEAIATGDPYLQDNKNKEDLQIDSRNIYHDSSMEMTLGLPSISSQPKHNIHKGNDNALLVKTVQFSYDRLDTLQNTLEVSPELEDDRRDNINSNKKNASCQQVERDSIQVFHDISMEDTLGPTILTNSTNNLTKLNHYTNQSILSSNIDMISNSINGSKNFNKENNYEPSIRYSNREESFHRITSDELNTLCASMNLPTLRCSRSESVQNNYISLYNDASVQRNSFKNNTNFQQQPTHTNNTFSEEKDDFNNRIGTCESFNKESNFQVFCDADSGERNKNFSAIQTNPVDNCVKGKNFDYEKYQQRCDKVTVYHDDSIEMRKNLESPNKSVYRNNNVSDYLSSINPSIKIANNFHNINNESNRKVSSVHTTNSQTIIKLPIGNINNTHYDLSPSRSQTCAANCTREMHERIDHYDRNTKTLSAAVNTRTDVQRNICDNTENERFKNSEIQIYHDTSMELTTDLPKSLNTNKQVKKVNETSLNKNNIASNLSEIMNTSMEISINPDKDKNNEILKSEHTLSRIPSDNTDILLATMGFKTELSHPLIINDKTTIKVLNNPLLNKTYHVDSRTDINNEIEFNKRKIVRLNTRDENESITTDAGDDYQRNKTENVIKNMEIPIILNDGEINCTTEDYLDKRNMEISEKIYLLPENYSKELEEIEPPSFLCSDSIQDDSCKNMSFENDRSNTLSQDLNEKHTNLLILEAKNNSTKMEHLESNQKTLTENLKRNSSSDSDSLSEQLRKKLCKRSPVKICSRKQINNPAICENNEIEKSLAPILLLIEDIKNYEKRNDCIWSIRTISERMIIIDFITKSFVIVIRLNDMKNSFVQDIKQLEVFSRLSANSKNNLLKIVHNLLLLKLKPTEMLEKYKMYEHILPLLEYISSEVIFAMNFMFDLKRIEALHLLSIDNERINFMVASRKANIILKVSLIIKIFKEIGPNDINVACILGDIRKTDIMQLIINIKRDYKFLSRYINDIKDYITLMEESTCLNR